MCLEIFIIQLYMYLYCLSIRGKIYDVPTYIQVVTNIDINIIFFQCDLPQRQIDQLDIEAFYKENNFIGWTETSAKDGLMVNDSMQ